MRNAWAVCKREFRGYFTTPVGYVVTGAFAAISGLGFAVSFILYAMYTKNPGSYGMTTVPDLEENFLSPFLVFCGQLIMFIGPLITMRLLAEERSRGTIELLFTQPLRDREIIFGKYFAALGMLVVMMVIIGVYMGEVAYFAEVETVVLLFGLVAVFLMGAAFISLGLFTSAVAKSPTTAATMAFALWFVMYVIGTIGEDMPEERPAPDAWPQVLQRAAGFGYTVFRALVTELPIDTHAKDMAQGIFQPRDIVYYLLFISFFLFLTFRALEARRWKG